MLRHKRDGLFQADKAESRPGARSQRSYTHPYTLTSANTRIFFWSLRFCRLLWMLGHCGRTVNIADNKAPARYLMSRGFMLGLIAGAMDA